MESKRILIAGANGFLGSNLSRELNGEGYDVNLLIRRNSNTWRINDFMKDVTVHTLSNYENDSFGLLLNSIKPDILINTIGEIRPRDPNDKFSIWKSNFYLIQKMFSYIKEPSNIFFLQAGTSFEYGKESLIKNPLRENDVCNPISEYGISKLFATEYLNYLSEIKTVKGISFRIFNLYGQFEGKSRLIPDLITNGLNNKEIVLKSPKVIRDFIHINDVVSAFKKGIQNQDSIHKFQIINVGTGIASSLEDVANYIKNITNCKVRIEEDKSENRPENNIPGPIANIEKGNVMIKWNAKINIKNGLELTSNWFKNHMNLYRQ